MANGAELDNARHNKGTVTRKAKHQQSESSSLVVVRKTSCKRSTSSSSQMKNNQSSDSMCSIASSSLSYTCKIKVVTRRYPAHVKYQNSSMNRICKKILKFKILLRVACIVVITILLVYTLIISIMNISECPIDYRIPVYLIVFSVCTLARILLLYSCPYSYSTLDLRKKFEFFTHKKRKTSETQRRADDLVIVDKKYKLFKCCLKFLKSKKKIKFKRGRRRAYQHRHDHHHRIRYFEKLIDAQSVRYCFAYLVQRLLDVFILCWFLYGNYIVFNVKDFIVFIDRTPAYSNRTSNTSIASRLDSPDYCNLLCYMTAFYQIIIVYALIMFLFLIFVFHSVVKLTFFNKNFDKHQYHVHA
jgi:hypothetical protein